MDSTHTLTMGENAFTQQAIYADLRTIAGSEPKQRREALASLERKLSERKAQVARLFGQALANPRNPYTLTLGGDSTRHRVS